MTTEVPQSQGEDRNPQGSPHSAFVENWWVQKSFFPPDLVEVVLRFGFSAETRHLQLQAEAFNPETKELLGMMSQPHIHVNTRHEALEQAVHQLQRLARGVLDPDPF